ncbi:hypothetical protein SERLADRAFT_478845 [Serpula lacrymans var. lacrymans S7.9]|uniref:Uncharacterized protein n=1 Tax=Serpula lacrymans var. lacrymans (strain S7.9) TaxID=578457 RepID=F8PB02_SERL9|nr:uncharacterized protein SERLADRAFT_478845 [Serpula lacrymans var. lacrymans S7.9]EGO19442.1 hypothetical protein SERLADRAFT_478845 [Serpula lacrymans var. lacrymans S7.9]
MRKRYGRAVRLTLLMITTVPNAHAMSMCSDSLWILRCLGTTQTLSRRDVFGSSDSTRSSNPTTGIIVAIVVVLIIAICLAVVRHVRGSSTRSQTYNANGYARHSGGLAAPSSHQAYGQMQLNRRSHWIDPDQPLPLYNAHISEDQVARQPRLPSPFPLYVPSESPVAPPSAIVSGVSSDIPPQSVPLYTPTDHPITTPMGSVQVQNTSNSLPSVPPPAYTPL